VGIGWQPCRRRNSAAICSLDRAYAAILDQENAQSSPSVRHAFGALIDMAVHDKGSPELESLFHGRR